MNYKAKCPQCDEWMDVERVDNGVMMVWHGVHCGWGHAYFADEDVRTLDTMTPAGQRCGNCRWWDGTQRIGTCTWDAPIPIWAQAEMGGVFREMHAIHGKDCPTWQAK